jgi:manganese/iron transport system permease protein/iron/zinc/copper transport system permease protein
MHTLLEPFSFGFFRHGVIVATLAGALCGLVGVYVVLRGMSYIGHGLSHAIFGGAAASAVINFNFYIGAGLWGLASALMIGRVTRRRIIGSDAAIGVITTTSFALGLVLFGFFGVAHKSVDAVLFGSILGVSVADVWVVATVTAAIAATVFFRYRALLFVTFDPEVADVSGVNVARTDALLMLMLAVSILVTMKVIGVVLIAAMLVIPPVIARMLTNSFSRMLWLSVVIGAVSGFAGMYLSYHLDVSSGATIVLVGGTLFGIVFAATGPRGLRRAAGLEGHGPALPVEVDAASR